MSCEKAFQIYILITSTCASEYDDYIVENIDRVSESHRRQNTISCFDEQDINKGMESLLYSLYIAIKYLRMIIYLILCQLKYLLTMTDYNVNYSDHVY